MTETSNSKIQGHSQFRDVLIDPRWSQALQAAASCGSIAVIGPNEQPTPETPTVEVRQSPRLR